MCFGTAQFSAQTAIYEASVRYCDNAFANNFLKNHCLKKTESRANLLKANLFAINVYCLYYTVRNKLVFSESN